MFLRATLAGLLLATTLFSAASACPAHDRQAQSCAPGYAWSENEGTCVPEVTG
ncbi:hypothetical protein [Aliiroseovarius sp.]|uniref:hypothetical protein n=1 Tax=Aliiroseovarius sp. TaxID=1872442 RepID=UPI003BAA8507